MAVSSYSTAWAEPVSQTTMVQASTVQSTVRKDAKTPLLWYCYYWFGVPYCYYYYWYPAYFYYYYWWP